MTWSGDVSAWNLALPASLLVVACAPRLIVDSGESGGTTTDATTSGRPTTTGPTPSTTAPSTTSTTGSSSTAPPPECRLRSDCGPGYVCIDGSCYYDGCFEECCTGGLCECFVHEDCGQGEACFHAYCEYVGTVFGCVESFPEPFIPPITSDGVALSFVSTSAAGPDHLAIITTDQQLKVAPPPFPLMAPTTLSLGVSDAVDIATLDFNADGFGDLVVGSEELQLFTGDGAGNFSLHSIWSRGVSALVTGAFDGTAGPDVVGLAYDGGLRLFTTTSAGIIQEREFGGGVTPWLVAGPLPPFAESGFDDLVVDDDLLSIFEGGSEFGQMQYNPPTEGQFSAYAIPVILDYDGDGLFDLAAVERNAPARVTTWHNEGSFFGPAVVQQLRTGEIHAATGLNLDGGGGEALVLGGGDGILIVRFDSLGFPYSACPMFFEGSNNVSEVASGDFEHDGIEELAFIAEGRVIINTF